MKQWFIDRYLAIWAKETVLSDNRRLQKDKAALEQKVQRLEAYIRGLEAGIKSSKRIAIYTKGGEQ